MPRGNVDIILSGKGAVPPPLSMHGRSRRARSRSASCSRPPAARELLPAFGLACLMAVTFLVTTEAIRRGLLGIVSPITALGPALTAVLAVALIGERPGWLAYAGIAMTPLGVALLSARRRNQNEQRQGWTVRLSSRSCCRDWERLFAKLVVTPAGSFGPPAHRGRGAGRGRTRAGAALALDDLGAERSAGRYTVLAYALAGVATIGYLSALAAGPAAVVVPLVSASPAVAGVLGLLVLKERLERWQLAGLAAALVGASLPATQG